MQFQEVLMNNLLPHMTTSIGYKKSRRLTRASVYIRQQNNIKYLAVEICPL